MILIIFLTQMRALLLAILVFEAFSDYKEITTEQIGSYIKEAVTWNKNQLIKALDADRETLYSM